MAVAVPSLSSKVDPEVKRAISAIVSQLNGVLSGSIPVGHANTAGSTTDTGDTASVIPFAVADLLATGAFNSIILTWNHGQDSEFIAGFEIWRCTVSDLGLAVKVGWTTAKLYADTPSNTSSAITYYYWVRAVSVDNVSGPFTGPTSASTATDPTYVLEVLAGQISESELATALNTRIDLVDTPVTGLIDQMTATIASVSAEVINRANADDALDNALALLNAARGEEFDCAKIWNFEADAESWAGLGTPTVTGGWLRPADHDTDPYVYSPVGVGLSNTTYTMVKARVRKVGAPPWQGYLYWRSSADTDWSSARRATVAEPEFDADGITTVVWRDVPWLAAIDRVRIDCSSAQTATDYFEIDWVAIGRPSAADYAALISAASTASATATEAVATDLSLLATTVGTNTSAISEEITSRTTADDALAEQIFLMAAGTGEQFDYGEIWYFDSGVDGFTGNGTPTESGGWLRPADHATDPYVISPDGLIVDSDQYTQVKVRIMKTGSPVWQGTIWWQATGDSTWDAARSVTIAEPSTYDANGIAVATADMTWTGVTIEQIRIDLSSDQSATDYFKLDWVAIGRPAPGASTAMVYNEVEARTTAVSALAQDISDLTAVVNDAETGLPGAFAAVSSAETALAGVDTALSESISTVSAAVSVHTDTLGVMTIERLLSKTEMLFSESFDAYGATPDLSSRWTVNLATSTLSLVTGLSGVGYALRSLDDVGGLGISIDKTITATPCVIFTCRFKYQSIGGTLSAFYSGIPLLSGDLGTTFTLAVTAGALKYRDSVGADITIASCAVNVVHDLMLQVNCLAGEATVVMDGDIYGPYPLMVSSTVLNLVRIRSYLSNQEDYILDDVAIYAGNISIADLVATAQSTANTAVTASTAANLALNDIADEDMLTPGEKPPIIQQHAVFVAEQSGIDVQATAFGITTEKTAYDNAMAALVAYLATLTTTVLWSDTSGNTTIVRATFLAAFTAVYTTRQALLDAINAKAKVLADAAQATGDTAQLTADGKNTVFVQVDVPTANKVNDQWIDLGSNNLVMHSDAIDNPYWVIPAGATIVADATTNYAGEITADKLQETVIDAYHYASNPVFAYTAGKFYLLSVDVQAAGRNFVRLALVSTAFGTIRRVSFNLTTGVAGSVTNSPEFYTSRDLGNGWWRVCVGHTASSTASTHGALIYTEITIGNASYLGDGASGVHLARTVVAELDSLADAEDHWQAQYIPTTTAPVDNIGYNRLHRWTGTAWESIQDTAILQAQFAAEAAQAAADAAQDDADAAHAVLLEIASDSLLTPVEKPPVIQRRDVLVAEQSGIDAQATAYGITTEKTAYDNALSALVAYLATLTTPVLWSDTTGNTTIVRDTFLAAFTTVDAARQALLNKIYAAAKVLADTAQSAADGAQGTADTAIINAATAQTTAEAAADAAGAAASAITLLDAQVNNATTGLPVTRATLLAEQVTRAADDGAIAYDLGIVQTTVGGHTASIAEQATSIDGLNLQYTVKLDNNGFMAGFGVASSAVDGVPFSEFYAMADRFAIINPPVAPKVITSLTRTDTTATAVCSGHGFLTGEMRLIAGAAQGEYNGVQSVTVLDPNTFTYPVAITAATPATVAEGLTNIVAGESPAKIPFIVQGGVVYMDVAMIADATITDAKIAALAADKITTGYLAAARIAAGSIAATHIGTNEIIAYAANIKNAVITGAKIALATIANANMGIASIGEANIINANVSTLKIAGNAVTIPVSAYTVAEITIIGSSFQTIQTAAITTGVSGTPVHINASFSSETSSFGTCYFEISVYRDSTLIFSAVIKIAYDEFTGYTGRDIHAFSLQDTPSISTATYTLKAKLVEPFTSINAILSSRSLLLLACKR